MARYILLFVLSLMVAMGGQSLQAAGPPNFSGIWKVDLNAPESIPMEALLEAQGVPKMKRKAMDTMPMTQVITQTDKTLTIKIEVAVGAQTQVLTLDGRTEIHDTDQNIGKIEFRSFWDKNGTTIVSVSKYATQDGHNAEWTTRRYLQDQGKTLIVDHVLTFDDGRKLNAKRIFRKQ
jgi:hypothetical protein